MRSTIGARGLWSEGAPDAMQPGQLHRGHPGAGRSGTERGRAVLSFDVSDMPGRSAWQMIATWKASHCRAILKGADETAKRDILGPISAFLRIGADLWTVSISMLALTAGQSYRPGFLIHREGGRERERERERHIYIYIYIVYIYRSQDFATKIKAMR